MSHQAKDMLHALQLLSLPDRALKVARFFKTGKGDYAENDLFLGISMPEIHQMAKFYSKAMAKDHNIEALETLITYPEHEARMLAIIILVNVYQYKQSTAVFKQEIVEFYLKNTLYVNNWDLVDQSAYKILGDYCYHYQQDEVLDHLSLSANFWEQRIAVVASLYYIKKSSFDLALRLILRNMAHPQSLMQKANGWMLREIGKKNEAVLIDFLTKNIRQLPRTTLRYAIERFSAEDRKSFLAL